MIRLDTNVLGHITDSTDPQCEKPRERGWGNRSSFVPGAERQGASEPQSVLESSLQAAGGGLKPGLQQCRRDLRRIKRSYYGWHCMNFPPSGEAQAHFD